MYNRKYAYYEIPQIENYLDLVKKKYREHADDIAFAWYEKNELQRVTYRDFAYDVCLEAARILERCGNGKHVGIIGANSYDWLVFYMAIIFSGNVAVVLDKDMLTDELADCVDRMDISLMISDCNSIEKCSNLKETIEIDTFEQCKNKLKSCTAKKLIADYEINNPDDVCSIFMTSGTTGKRKGVMLTHRNIAADINESCKMFELTGNTLAVLPFHHAFGLIVAVWMVFNYGYTVFISQGLRRVKKELALVKPKTMMLVPLFIETFYKQICMLVKNEKKENEVLWAKRFSDILFQIGIDVRRRLFYRIIESFGGQLEYIICGGAALDEFYVKEFRSYGIEVLNGYGTTECSPVVAVNRNHYHKDGSVGIPLPNSKVKISPNGEIMIYGAHVMAGYYHEPEETAAVMYEGWYKSGDLGEVDDKGFIKITGRKKNLIIFSSGENISPEEIEERLLRIEYIDEVVVKANNNELIAEIYSKDADAETIVRIKREIDRVNRSMPMYKRVTKISFRSEGFPKTTTNKIIRER